MTPIVSHSSEDEGPTRMQNKTSFSMNDGDIAGLRKKRTPLNPSLIKTGVGTWEVHTRGIGAKLLLQV